MTRFAHHQHSAHSTQHIAFLFGLVANGYELTAKRPEGASDV